MNNHPSTEVKSKTTEPPAPELLRAQFDNKSSASEVTASNTPKPNMHPRHGAYRPSHKATFIGLAVVILILAVNVGIVVYLINIQSKTDSSKTQAEVTISPAVLDTLGVSRNPVGNAGTELVVSPNSTFKGTVKISGDVSVSGLLKLNSRFIANDASLTKLEAGEATLSQLNVSGDGTMSNLNLRKDLTVVGSTRLQGAVTVGQLLTVNNNVNILGNLAVGGTLSARSFQASSLVSDTTLTIGGHIITRGVAPSVSRGGGLDGIDTVSISGNDVSGTVAVNIGAGLDRTGIVAYVSFINQYSNIPHVIITAVGSGARDVYVDRSAAGFSIGVSSISTGGHAFDFVVMQ